MMIKPKPLKSGDKVALVSLSSGMFGEKESQDRLKRTINNLKEIFNFEVVLMPNALIGTKEVYEHPEKRAEDLMNAFKDDSIKAIFTLTGGEDTIRILPYIDFEVIKKNPKIFMGFSDTTANHFMMYKAGLTSFYGPAAGVEFSLGKVLEENIQTVKESIMEEHETLELSHYNILANDPKDWSMGLLDVQDDPKGYEVIQGQGIVEGQLIGGCIDVFSMIIGTDIWPSKDAWQDKILFMETSDEQPEPDMVKRILYNLGAQGIIQNLKGIIVGRPKNGKYYQEYNDILKEVTRIFKRPDLPIITNAHFGHSWLWHVLPFGVPAQINCEEKKITLLASGVEK